MSCDDVAQSENIVLVPYKPLNSFKLELKSTQSTNT